MALVGENASGGRWVPSDLCPSVWPPGRPASLCPSPSVRRGSPSPSQNPTAPSSPRVAGPVAGPARSRRTPARDPVNTLREGAPGQEAPRGRRAGAGLTRGPSARAGRGAGGGGRKRAAARAGRRGPVTSLGFQGSLPAARVPSSPPSSCPPPGPRLRAAAGISRSQLAHRLVLGPSLLLLPLTLLLPSPTLFLTLLFLSFLLSPL